MVLKFVKCKKNNSIFYKFFFVFARFIKINWKKKQLKMYSLLWTGRTSCLDKWQILSGWMFCAEKCKRCPRSFRQTVEYACLLSLWIFITMPHIRTRLFVVEIMIMRFFFMDASVFHSNICNVKIFHKQYSQLVVDRDAVRTVKSKWCEISIRGRKE